MSISCEICSQYYDHNQMQHIYELEAHVETLILRVDDLEDKIAALQEQSK